MNPTISVIVPVYNVKKYVSRCIDSILSQTFKDFDLILIDDGSTDNSGVICDEYTKKDKKINVIHKKHEGVSIARNVGVSWALNDSNSDWICFVDSDDWINEHYLEYLYKAAIDSKGDISVCNFIKTEDTNDNKEVFYTVENVNTEDFYVNNYESSVIAVCKLYKKELLNNIKYPKNKINEDAFITYKLLFNYREIAFVDSILYYYFQREDSIMHEKWTVKRLNAIEALEEQLNYFINNNYSKAYFATVKKYLYFLAYNIKNISKDFRNREKLKKELTNKYKETIKNNINILSPDEKILYLSLICYPLKIFVYLKKIINKG